MLEANKRLRLGPAPRELLRVVTGPRRQNPPRTEAGRYAGSRYFGSAAGGARDLNVENRKAPAKITNSAHRAGTLNSVL